MIRKFVNQLSVKSGKVLLAIEERLLHTRHWRPETEKKGPVGLLPSTSEPTVQIIIL